MVGFKGEIFWDLNKPNGTHQKKLDVSLMSRLGWDYKIPLNEGLKLTLEDFSKKSKVDGKLLKIKFGGWLFNVFKLLSKLKFLRGTKLDPFGYLNERKKERELIRDYKETITDIGIKINKSNYETAVKIASVPDQIRGFGHVKEKNIKEAINYRTDLLNSFHENT